MPDLIRNALSVLCLGGLLLAAGARADEDDPTEREYLLGVNLEGALTQQVDWSLEQAARFDRDQQLVSYAPQLGLSWSVTDWLTLGAAGRLLREADENGELWSRKRAMVDTALGFAPLKDWKLSYRLRWQGEWRQVDDKGTPRRFYLRNRLQVKYQGFDWIAPYVSAETYHRVDEGKKTTGVEKTRYTLGGDIKLNKHQGLDLYGRRQVMFNDDPDSYLIGLEYSYRF